MIIDIDSSQLRTATRLVERAGLPVDDMAQVNWFALVGWSCREIVTGVAGVQKCGNSLLLRSVAVDESCRGSGIAYALIDALHKRTCGAGYSDIYLLTLDAVGYFCNKFDYYNVDRTRVPGEIAQSDQFLHICPETAILMGKSLGYSKSEKEQ